MRRLGLILAFTLILILGIVFPNLLPVVIFVIILAGYLDGVRFSLWFSGIASLYAIYLLLKTGDFGFSLGSIISFNLSPFLAVRIKERLLHQKESAENLLKEKSKVYDELLDEFVTVSTRNTRLEEEASEIASLYEITREMSANLEFTELFEIFRKNLCERLNFTRCRLIILKENGHEEPQVEGVRDINKDKEEDSAEPLASESLTSVEQNLLRQMNEEKETFKKEGYISVPLIVKGVLIGALIVEGLSEADLEWFTILAQQFSLEIKKAKLYKMMQELAITDGLTQLYVRRHFLERLDEELRRSERHNLKLSFLMIDLDHFKGCNDRHGHLVGDVVLRKVGQVLKSNIREIDLVGRYGGEEFSIILPETNQEGAYQVAERLRKAIAGETIRAYDENISITISIGIAVFPDHAQGAAVLIENGDRALYRAKEHGRNKTVIYQKPD